MQSYKHTIVDGDEIAKWWPNQLNLKILTQNNPRLTPTASEFSYKKAFETLPYEELKKDLVSLMTTSVSWWPADYGHYGPFFIRMAWHSAGTYRIMDGRGGAATGNQRFAPLNSWPDNVNLDKARRLLWPLKKKYGEKISWADLMILAGTVAMESMGLQTYGFGGGREDIWQTEEDIYWGEEEEWLADTRHAADKKLQNPLAAVQMGLIYVNPEGPNGEPNVLAAAEDIRVSFRRMGMNDAETIALIAGGHTFGKSHGAADPQKYVGPEPEAAPLEQQGFGWKNSYKSGKGADTISSGLEGAWTPTPTKWDNSFLEILFKYEWNLQKSPAGAWQWVPVNPDEEDLTPDAHIAGKKEKTIMFTTDLALRMDPEFEKVSRSFLKDPKLFARSFAKAWFKLTHRDMGPKSRYLGPEVPKEDFLWQDPLPDVSYSLVNEDEIQTLKKEIIQSGLQISELLYVAWSSAATYRDSDKRGGANGARIALEPQKNWQVNEPEQLQKVLSVLRKIQENFNAHHTNQISLADIIVLGGVAALEKALKNGGYTKKVPFLAGRVDATQEQTDVHSFAYLEPKEGDAFRNYLPKECKVPAERLLLDKAQQLTLSVPEMTVLIGGLRVLWVNYKQSDYGVLSDKKERLSNDFFVNLADMNLSWSPADEAHSLFEGFSHGKIKYRATRADLIFGANSQLRAQTEFYAQNDKQEQFADDFIAAWNKVMNLDRFDIL
ncbi:catalase/peroxidase HPI [Sulfurimonas sp. SWIR-19]|uniref:catalase/peroxidase HPI n=1 Tax=Sulfurimonas sp. SWIR-19 TaxID=2878390 RepID=UPI001CF4305F|nr:catalase/peroxidase HPI [Sulfurimonas sp. SWIR-19]UCN00022.1 catalase/peroxidase HPI [Sulfurimonas sp. SWIR-19]